MEKLFKHCFTHVNFAKNVSNFDILSKNNFSNLFFMYNLILFISYHCLLKYWVYSIVFQSFASSQWKIFFSITEFNPFSKFIKKTTFKLFLYLLFLLMFLMCAVFLTSVSASQCVCVCRCVCLNCLCFCVFVFNCLCS